MNGIGLGMVCFIPYRAIRIIQASMGVFTPLGSPLLLNIALIVIEIVSGVVRLFAMVVRLCVNLTCGHLILRISGIMRLAVYMFIILEVGVTFIQSNVFWNILNI
jgi:F0F1-type ATP synthase membrane subunit a